MVFCSPDDTQAFIDAMAGEGVRIGAVAGRIRMVTHVGVSADDVESVIEAARRIAR